MVDKLKEIILKNKEKMMLLGQFLLVGTIFFGLGILYQNSKIIKNNHLIEVIQEEYLAANTSDLVTKQPSENGSLKTEPLKDKKSEISKDLPFVASKNGKAYYKTSCSNRIKDENKIYFKTEEDAQKSGFSPAKTCFK